MVTTARIVAARQVALMCTAVYTADPMVTKADASLPPQRQGQLDLFIRFCMTHLLVLPTNTHTHTQHAASLPCSLLDGTQIPNVRNNLGGASSGRCKV